MRCKSHHGPYHGKRDHGHHDKHGHGHGHSPHGHGPHGHGHGPHGHGHGPHSHGSHGHGHGPHSNGSHGHGHGPSESGPCNPPGGLPPVQGADPWQWPMGKQGKWWKRMGHVPWGKQGLMGKHGLCGKHGSWGKHGYGPTGKIMKKCMKKQMKLVKHGRWGKYGGVFMGQPAGCAKCAFEATTVGQSSPTEGPRNTGNRSGPTQCRPPSPYECDGSCGSVCGDAVQDDECRDTCCAPRPQRHASCPPSLP